MVNRAFKAIRRADIVFLMVDVEAGITEQVNPRIGVMTREIINIWPTNNLVHFGGERPCVCAGKGDRAKA